MAKWFSGTYRGGIEITVDGCFIAYLANNTGHTSVKGELVHTSHSIDFAVDLLTADVPDCIGVVYASGFAVGDLMPVVIAGMPEVLLEDGSGATHGQWMRESAAVNGRATAEELPAPPANENHFHEIGHCLQTVVAGTDKLCRIVMHFN
jgi:hypothetical protein